MLKHRARSLNQARVLPGRRVDHRLEGAGADRDDRADGRRLQGFQPGRCAADRYARADARNAIRGNFRFFRVWLRPQDSFLAKDGVAHDGEVATRCGLPAIPVCAETIALSTMLALARDTDAKLHVCRLSSAAGVDMVRAAKREGLAVTCDVSQNHVHLSEMDIGFFEPNCRLSSAATQPARPCGAARRVAGRHD